MLNVDLMSMLSENLDSSWRKTYPKLERAPFFWNANVHSTSMKNPKALIDL
jgi:hypothetical protein